MYPGLEHNKKKIDCTQHEFVMTPVCVFFYLFFLQLILTHTLSLKLLFHFHKAMYAVYTTPTLVHTHTQLQLVLHGNYIQHMTLA